MPELVPIRVAPAFTIASAAANVRTPPEAFTPISGPTVFRIRARNRPRHRADASGSEIEHMRRFACGLSANAVLRGAYASHAV